MSNTTKSLLVLFVTFVAIRFLLKFALPQLDININEFSQGVLCGCLSLTASRLYDYKTQKKTKNVIMVNGEVMPAVEPFSIDTVVKGGSFSLGWYPGVMFTSCEEYGGYTASSITTGAIAEGETIKDAYDELMGIIHLFNEKEV